MDWTSQRSVNQNLALEVLHMQSYMDLLSFGGTSPDGKTVEALSKGSLGQYSAVLQNSFRFAVFPKRLITFNPMQYVVKRIKDDEYELFTEDGTGDLPIETPTISMSSI